MYNIGNTEANIAIGHRYHKGIGVPDKCTTAINFLEIGANTAAKQIDERGYPIFNDRSHLSEQRDAKYRKEVDHEVITYDFYNSLYILYISNTNNI